MICGLKEDIAINKKRKEDIYGTSLFAKKKRRALLKLTPRYDLPVKAFGNTPK